LPSLLLGSFLTAKVYILFWGTNFLAVFFADSHIICIFATDQASHMVAGRVKDIDGIQRPTMPLVMCKQNKER